MWLCPFRWQEPSNGQVSTSLAGAGLTLARPFLDPPARCPSLPVFGWEGAPKIDYPEKEWVIVLSSLEDLDFRRIQSICVPELVEMGRVPARGAAQRKNQWSCACVRFEVSEKEDSNPRSPKHPTSKSRIFGSFASCCFWAVRFAKLVTCNGKLGYNPRKL